MDDVTTVRGLSEKQAMERVIQFAQRFGTLHGDLAAHAAFPLVLTPDLLYRLWASFLPQIPWTTVSDILLSPLCREVGYELYEMDPGIRNILLGELREDSRFGESRLRELAQFLREYVRVDLQADDPDQRELADAQRLTALAHTEPDEAARQIASKISDPSQLTGADLLRVATLTETLSQPLREYSPLVAYARGVERLAYGDMEAASTILNRVFEEKQDIKIGDITLQRPRRAREPVPAQAEETGIPEALKIFIQVVYISYAWGGESEEIVNQIEQALGQRGIKIIRDKRDLGYKGSISTFLERTTGQGNYVVMVINDKYLRSPNCMFELLEIANRKKLHYRVFPILLSDAKIYDPLGRLEYVHYWESKRAELAQAMKEVDHANLQGIREDMDLYDRIRDTISGLTSLLKDMNTLTPEIHRESDFSDLYNAIERRMKAGPAAAPGAPIPREYFEPETVLIPAGPFRMGSPPRKEVASYETPQHEVDLPAYRIGKYPVTNAQYREFIHETGKAVAPPGWGTQGVPEGSENRPVIRVTWYEALEYCQWLSQKTGRHYTLPNEAQWEKACRGGGNSLYPWGDTFDPMRCNANPTSITHVDSYPPQNDFGGFDFVGNVRQWTCTIWGENPDAPDPRYSYPWRDDGRNDLNASRQVRRVLRGSSYNDGTRLAYCSFRSGQVPDERGVAGAGCGFRVVMIDPAPQDVQIGNIGSSGDVIAGGNVNVVQPDTLPGVRKRAARPEPPRPPRLFIGRQEELARLERSILKRETIVITGPQGIGKSTLLRQAANGEAARAMPDGVLWIDNVDEQGKLPRLDDIIQRLFDTLYQSDPPMKVSLETSRPYLSEIEALIILDGLELSSDAFNTLADLFPKSAVLLSSITTPTGSDLEMLHLGPLPAGDAIQLFMELAGPAYENADISLLDSICRLLGSVPLGIVMTARILQEENTSLELIREILAASIPQSRDESAAGLERAYELASTLGTAPAAEQKAKIFISYSRRDPILAEFLADRLSALGHSVFFDIASMRAGETWTQQVTQGIKTSDFFIVLLPDASLQSSYAQDELRRAIEYAKENRKPRILPVRIGYDQELPASLSTLLDPVQSFSWSSERDNERLLRELVQAIQGDSGSGLEESSSGLQDTRPARLPEGLVREIENAYPTVRLGAVQQLSRLLTGNDLELARAARESLERLEKEDDSRRVSQAAAQALEAVRRPEHEQRAATNQENISIETPIGIAESEAPQASELLQRLGLYVEITPDWGERGGAWNPGTWTLAELERLHRTLALMSDLMGGREAFLGTFIRDRDGLRIQKSDAGTHGREPLMHTVSLSMKGSFSAWTIVHEFAHLWDENYGGVPSRDLERYTGGSTNRLRSVSARLLGNWDAGPNGPENKPGRYGRLPGCNRAGYFYGDKPSGSNWSFNRKEDFAESVAMYVGWERDNDLSAHARSRIVRYTLPNGAKDAFGIVDNWADYAKYFYPEDGDYTKTKRWQFVDDLFKGRSSITSKSQIAS
jgi:formylglycine-generating enzyme required for sulfatase activity